MDIYQIDKIRNIGLVGHAGTGKTSLVEAFLFNSGKTTRLGSTAQGTSTADYNPDEIERKITISAKFLHTVWKDTKINIIDMPGYADFYGEVESGARAVDCAVVVVDAAAGVEFGTERVWGLVSERKLARAIFINKLDRDGVNLDNVLSNIKESLSRDAIYITYPVGASANFKSVINLLNDKDVSSAPADVKPLAEKARDALIEKIAETDDKLIEEYLDGKALTDDEIRTALRSAISSSRIVPIFVGSAAVQIGIKETMDAVVDYFPSPLYIGSVSGKDPSNNSDISRKLADTEPFSAFVFKTISDPYVGQLTLFKICSGALASNAEFYNVTRRHKERIGQLLLLQGKDQVPVASVHSGDIAAVAKLKDTATNDTLCDEKKQIVFEPIAFPEPAISYSIKPKSRQDEEKISIALNKLLVEDPTFKTGRDPQTKELIISGMGDLHLEVMIARLKKKYGVEVEVGMPKVAYKETIKKKAQGQGKYKRQSGGRGQYGDVWLELEPLARGGNFEFVDKIVGGAIPRNYIPSVEKGVTEAMSHGIIAGYPLVDVRVILYDGSFHPVDSSDMAFQIAGSMALRKVALEANPILLEPIMNVEIIVPEEFMGAITGDINSRRGRIQGIEARSKNQVVDAAVPLAEMLKYATELRSMTGGRGSYTMRFSHYEEIPGRIAAPLIAAAAKHIEVKEEV